MPWFRVYIDKKIVDGEGGDHSRIFDYEAKAPYKVLQALELEDDEEVNQIVTLAGDPNYG